MTKPVRGWTDEDELDDIKTCYTKVYGNHVERSDGAIPVLIVSIDDASVEAMVERACQHSYACSATDMPASASRFRGIIRAALGIDGGGA